MSAQYSQTAIHICDWLVQPSTTGTPEELFGHLNQKIREAGVPVFRAAFSLLTIHPEVYSKQLIWRRGESVQTLLRSHEVIASSIYTDSPVAVVRSQRSKMRLRLEHDPDTLRYDVSREIKQAGGTDYVILPVEYRNGTVGYASWATDTPGGFVDSDIALFEELIPTLSLRFELENTKFATDSLLGTYLGGSAAQRVLSGTFRKGQGQNIRAVIWTCDLRGFTQMVDTTPIADVLQTLDLYFACVATPIMRRGGEILKYIGDAVLGIFPIDAGNPGAAAGTALAAAADAFHAAEVCNQKRKLAGLLPLEFGLALHIGDVMFGNIGTAGRLDFTVIGPAVNEASRVESLCKELGRSILLTEAFVRISGRTDCEPLGRTQLRGVSTHMNLFSINPAALNAE